MPYANFYVKKFLLKTEHLSSDLKIIASRASHCTYVIGDSKDILNCCNKDFYKLPTQCAIRSFINFHPVQ